MKIFFSELPPQQTLIESCFPVTQSVPSLSGFRERLILGHPLSGPPLTGLVSNIFFFNFAFFLCVFSFFVFLLLSILFSSPLYLFSLLLPPSIVLPGASHIRGSDYSGNV